jgi:molybdopterin/thiamine biosynthesis adenylyltransferase
MGKDQYLSFLCYGGFSVLIIGAGGLGCPVSMYLVAAGIGKLCIVDHDVVSLDNLHRQIAHDEQRVDQPKVDSLKKSLLRQVNFFVKTMLMKPLPLPISLI